jgi:hypothetical protein
MKIFISQPMNGKTDSQIKEERKAIEKYFIDKGDAVLDTLFDFEENTSPIYYLGKSIEYMADADLVVFLSGWNEARGCLIEYKVATEYGKKILILP